MHQRIVISKLEEKILQRSNDDVRNLKSNIHDVQMWENSREDPRP